MLPPALRHKAYRNYLAGSFVSNVGSNIQACAILLHVYNLTHSSFMVGMLGLVRVGPLVVFSLFGGVVADQIDRRKIMLLTQSCMAVLSLLLFVLTSRGLESVGLLYIIVALLATTRAFDGPARQAMQVGLVPIEDFPNAASLNGMAWRLSDVLGPIVVAVFLLWGGHAGFSGLGLCYATNFVSFFAVLVAVWCLPTPASPPAEDRPKSFKEVLSLIGEGLHFVNKTPVVRSAMWIDFWATLLSGAEALLPAFAVTCLHLDKNGSGYAMLSASMGAGALIAATRMAWIPTVHKQGKLVVVMIAWYGLATICFGVSQNLFMAMVSLAMVGAADMVSTVLRQTIRQLATPDELRGRMTATSSLFHISGPQLGDFEAGAVAKFTGERFSVVLGGALCLLVAARWSRAKALVGYEHKPEGVGSSA